jgi:hypothetical protein
MRKARKIPGRYRTFGRFVRRILRVNGYRFDHKEAERIARLSYWRSIGQPWLG